MSWRPPPLPAEARFFALSSRPRWATQPVYYAAEAIDARLSLPVDPDVAELLSEVLETLDRFLQADQSRDEGEHIRRRLTSIRRKALGSQLSAAGALS
jgi:hypothetical protein